MSQPPTKFVVVRSFNNKAKYYNDSSHLWQGRSLVSFLQSRNPINKFVDYGDGVVYMYCVWQCVAVYTVNILNHPQPPIVNCHNRAQGDI